MSKPLDASGLTFRQDYFGDPCGWKAIGALLMDIFDVDIGPLDELGGHDRSNLPSAYFDDSGRCIANLSAFSMPLMIDGRVVNAAGWQSGAVRPGYRGRGLFRQLIRVTLERCEAAGFEAIVLYTDKPALYEPYHFTTVPQHCFTGPPPAIARSTSTARPLDIRDKDDLALISTALSGRTPVSERFAVVDQRLMFLLNAHLVDGVQLVWLDVPGVVVAWRPDVDGGFELMDIAGPVIPPLADILAALSIRPSTVTVGFPPDRVDWRADAQPRESELVFMMRSTDTLKPTGPYCLSPMAEF